MNRLFLVRHGGSTGNANPAFYAFNDSAVCLTTDGVRQALNTAGLLAQVGGSTWLKPGNFDLQVYASEYSRAQQTARIALDQMGLLSIEPKIRSVLNERNYGSPYNPLSDSDPYYNANGSESSARSRVRVKAFLAEIEPMLEQADVLAFSHMGTLRALIADLRGLSDQEMMTVEVGNGAAFVFVRTVGPDGAGAWSEMADLPSPVIAKSAPVIEPPPVAPPPNVQ
jgi:broad specificity phosphatase PhoE